MEIHSQTEAAEAAREACRHYLAKYDPEANVNLEPGDLFSWQEPKTKNIFRYEYTEELLCEGCHLISISGVVFRRNVQVIPRGRMTLIDPRERFPTVKSVERLTIPIDCPTVTILGIEDCKLIRYDAHKDVYHTTADGVCAGLPKTWAV